MATKNPTDSEIAEWLRAESGDERLAFVFEETVCFYVPDRGHVQGMFMRDELSEVLVAYLVRAGRVFASLDQALEHYRAAFPATGRS